MATAKMNVSALYSALDRKRRDEDISWRQLAKAAQLSPSTLSRIRNGDAGPSVDAYMALTAWLGAEPNEFVDHESDLAASVDEEDFTAQIGTLLRSRNDLSDQDKDYLQDLIALTIKRIKSE